MATATKAKTPSKVSTTDDDRKAEIKLSTPSLTAHMELTIDFVNLAPEVDFEAKIEGPTAGNWQGTLRSDPSGQAQLIWRTPAAGDYKVSGKGGEGDARVDVSADFTVASYDADEDYRQAKRADRKSGGKKAKTDPDDQGGPAINSELR